jgi:hypothetical protein
MAHLKYETLLSYLEDQLSAEERSKVDLHLAEPCLQCGRRLSLLSTVVKSVVGDQTVAPREAVLERAVDIARNRRELPEHKPWIRVIAALSFDSQLQLSSAATRGASSTRQMLFTTEQLDIDLQIKPGPRESDLLGQMLSAQRSEGGVPAFVSLQNSAGAPLRATETDSLGKFAFRQIPSGIYDLIFDLENEEVAITGLEFRND